MKTELHKVLNIKNFFKITQLSDKNASYELDKPCKILLKNIESNWLRFLWNKTNKNYKVFLNKCQALSANHELPYGFITKHICDEQVYNHELDKYWPDQDSYLKFNLLIPHKDEMQYFIQWQRYRKYWWSSITTTPSLFGLDDIKNDNGSSHVNIVAKFPWGQETVETVSIQPSNIGNNSLLVTCSTSLERALFVLLLDGITNQTKKEYLRLHRTMAPFIISFALDSKENKDSLIDLASLLHHRLTVRKISALLPSFSLTEDQQIQNNLQMGVTYTAVLGTGTLANGIFHLLNSSTMLKEQVHMADFDSYAALICAK